MNEKKVLDPHIRAEIEALIVEHAWLLDNHRSGELDQCYTDDGRMCGIGPERNGRAEIAAYGAKRASMIRQSRHVSGIPRLLWSSDDEIHGTLTIILFRHDGEPMGDAMPIAVADAHDIYRKVGQRWLMKERRLALVFESEAHRS